VLHLVHERDDDSERFAAQRLAEAGVFFCTRIQVVNMFTATEVQCLPTCAYCVGMSSNTRMPAIGHAAAWEIEFPQRAPSPQPAHVCRSLAAVEFRQRQSRQHHVILTEEPLREAELVRTLRPFQRLEVHAAHVTLRRDAGHVMSHQNLHRPLSSAQVERGTVNDSSTIAQVDEFQCRRQLKADKPRVGDG
jgi:hypothetical protein